MMKQLFQITDQFHYFQLYPNSSKTLYSVKLMIFFQKEKRFYGSQYGFMNKHSTELAALEIIDRLLTDMDNCETPSIYTEIYPKHLTL